MRLPLPGRDLEKAPFGPHLSVGTGIAGTYGFPLSIEGAAPSLFNVNYIQTLYDRNQRKQADAAELQEEGSQAEVESVQQKAALEAGRIFLDLRNQRERHQYYQTQLESLGKTREIIAARVEAGVAQPRELTRAKLELAKTKVTLTTNEKNLQLLEEQLRQATGVAPGVSLTLESGGSRGECRGMVRRDIAVGGLGQRSSPHAIAPSREIVSSCGGRLERLVPSGCELGRTL